ncbi:MAG: alpha/beta hydrolase [Pseudomonadota bacterium]
MPYFRTTDGLRLAYSDEDNGPGPTILCLAGLTRNMTDFDFFADALDRPGRIIRLDSRGRGASDWDADYNNYNVVKEAADAMELCDHLNLDRVTVLGASRGGILGMVMAATRPGLLSGLVLCDVGPDVDFVGLKRILAYIGKPVDYASYEEAAEDYFDKLGDVFVGCGPDYFLDIVKRSYNADGGALTLNYDPALRDATEAQLAVVKEHGHGLWPIFPMLKRVPLLALRAENSDILSDETLGKMRSIKSDMLSAVVRGVGLAVARERRLVLREAHERA